MQIRIIVSPLNNVVKLYLLGIHVTCKWRSKHKFLVREISYSGIFLTIYIKTINKFCKDLQIMFLSSNCIIYISICQSSYKMSPGIYWPTKQHSSYFDIQRIRTVTILSVSGKGKVCSTVKKQFPSTKINKSKCWFQLTNDANWILILQN